MTKEQFVRICNEHGVLAPDLVLEGIYLEVMAAVKKGQGSVVQQLIAAYIDEMKRVRGITPQVDAIVANQLKAVFKDTPAERAVELVRAFVNLPDPELAYVHWDLAKFRWSLQKCVAFLDRGIHVTRQQLNHAADPKRDEDAEALAIVGLIMERVGKDGRTNWSRAKEKIGEIGWAAVCDFGSWGSLCSQLTDANASTIRAQLREAVRSRMKRGADRQLPDPTNKHLPEPPADPARVRAIMAQAFNKKEIP
jgi:hypothetical protein